MHEKATINDVHTPFPFGESDFQPVQTLGTSAGRKGSCFGNACLDYIHRRAAPRLLTQGKGNVCQTALVVVKHNSAKQSPTASP